MIDVLIHNRSTKELEQLQTAVRSIAARLSEDDWNWNLFSIEEQTMAFLEQQNNMDFACLDIAGKQGIPIAEAARAGSLQAFIVLVAEASISPMEYLKPSIMPGGLLLRPYSDQQLQEVLRGALSKLTKLQEEDSGMFRVDLKTGGKMIPYSQICFFEARNKRIVLNTGTQEYSFGGTIDGLQEELPAAFVRCHRSFIVAKARIDQIFLSKNYLTLDNGMSIPLSRSYKSTLKELK